MEIPLIHPNINNIDMVESMFLYVYMKEAFR